MLLAQITDLHIKRPGLLAYKTVDTTERLRACVGALNALDPAPDAILITGDLADFGHADEYQSLRDTLAPLKAPVYLAVGNHDNRDVLRRTFPDHAYLQGDSPFIQYALDLDGLSVLVLDTQDPPHSGGRLDAARLAWLEHRLAERRGQPVMVAMHHPPFHCGIGHMDIQALNAADAVQLERILEKHNNVERVLCGHVHRAITTRFGNTIASICPSPSHQVAYDLRPNGPSAFVLEPPAFQIHAQIGRQWVTHTVFVEGYGGHHPFYNPDGTLID